MLGHVLLTFQAFLATVLCINLPNHGLPEGRHKEVQDLNHIHDLIRKANSITKSHISTNHRSHGCTPDKLRIRREWSSMPPDDRIAYTNAVRCLQKLPARSPPEWAPGAKSRFDDFVATHINQTATIHWTGNFMAWHRWQLWEYEQALRDECHYTGAHPYWNWALTALSGLKTSEVFNGGPASMSGDGKHIEKASHLVIESPEGSGPGGSTPTPILRETGNGGGCVESGPFKDYVVNLGPISLTVPGNRTITAPPGSNPLAYNPRCMTRDLSDSTNKRWVNATSVVNTILKPKDIYDFQMTLQGYPGSDNGGIHGDGHWIIGGDPASDTGSSPAEPVFYLHHAMTDLAWWIWQCLDWERRGTAQGDNALSGTRTLLNIPPSENATMEDEMYLHYVNGEKRISIGDAISVVDGPFCYVYE